MARRLLVATLLVCACGSNAEPSKSSPAPKAVVEEPSRDAPAVLAVPEAPALAETLARHDDELGPITYAQLKERHRQPYLPAHGLDIGTAEYRAEFEEAFELRAEEVAALHERGFVIPESVPARAGPVDLYYRVFAADLPVFISLDAVLHAWHRSLEDILAHTEERRISPALADSLQAMTGALADDSEAGRDALTYLWVARMLLGARGDGTRDAAADGGGWGEDPGTESPRETRAAMNLAVVPASVRPRVERLVGAVLQQHRTEVELFGSPREVDFGQFRPRSHYATTRPLSRYFRAMMWLARIDLLLDDPRQQALARTLAAAASNAEDDLRRMEEFYAVYVGRNTTYSALRLLEACAETGHAYCEADDFQPALAKLPAPAPIGENRSRPAMRVLPQRFAYDAWMLAQTTMPALEPQVVGGRSMASPLDVAFILGSDRALEHLGEEMALPGRAELPRRLEALRQTFEEHAPLSLDDTMYDHWLGALAAASKPRVDERFPAVMRTAAWHDHQIETVLGSWTELRHDTVLVVEQSEARIGCQYPRGYVEPVPEAFRRLGRAAKHLEPLHASLDARDEARIVEFLTSFSTAMEHLAAIAEIELSGGTMSKSDLAFLQRTVDRHEEGYGGVRLYDGWYPRLFWSPYATFTDAPPADRRRGGRGFRHTEGGRSEPVVTDAHTDADHDRALSLGVGHPQLMIVAVDAPDGSLALYGGPTYDLRIFEVAGSERMTDDAWRAAVDAGALPPRPAFTRSYR